MPLINGLKMACEPCIRGHRSTKCTHANERLMVPVRKPGRPLSSCPHPQSRPCSCGTVTAAIPRKQKCGCGTSTSSPPVLSSAAPTPATTTSTTATTASTTATASPAGTADSPMSTGGVTSPPDFRTPASSNGSSSRVRKAPAGRKGSSRRPSVDPASLERMDSNQLNILPAFDELRSPDEGVDPTFHAMSMGAGANANYAFPPSASTSNPLNGFHPVMYPAFPQAMPPPTPGAHINGHTPNGSARASCCGGGGEGSKPERSETPTPHTNGAQAEKKSCCSGKSAAPETPVPHQHQQQHPMMVMPPFQTPMAMPHGLYPLMPAPTLFTYPPQYGTFMQPLQPEQWRQVMSLLSLGQPPPQQAGGFGTGMTTPTAAPDGSSSTAGTPAAAMYAATPQQQQDAAWVPSKAATSHHCSCGDSCECVGCAAHPYNEATQNYVRSAWYGLQQESANASAAPQQQQQQQANVPTAAPYTNGNSGGSCCGGGANNEDSTASNGANGNGYMAPPMPAPAQTPTQPETQTTPTPQTPSDGASVPGDEQVYSSDDFFFVSYPFGETCAGDTASCPCGDDCQCIGCVIHGTAGPEFQE